MNATEDLSIGLHTMPDDAAIAVRTDRRQRVNRAFEAVECVPRSRCCQLKGLVIIVAANLTLRHTNPPWNCRIVERECGRCPAYIILGETYVLL